MGHDQFITCLFVFWWGLTEITFSSVEFGLEKGIIININSYEELEVMTDIMKELRQVLKKIIIELG